jgi:hypothetical protein
MMEANFWIATQAPTSMDSSIIHTLSHSGAKCDPERLSVHAMRKLTKVGAGLSHLQASGSNLRALTG